VATALLEKSCGRLKWKRCSRIRQKPARRGGSVEGSGWDAAWQGDGRDVATGRKEPLGSSYYNFNRAAISLFPQVPHGSLVVRSDPRRPFRVKMTPIPYAYVGQCCQYTSRNKGVSHLFSVPSDGVDAAFCLERLGRGRSNPQPVDEIIRRHRSAPRHLVQKNLTLRPMKPHPPPIQQMAIAEASMFLLRINAVRQRVVSRDA
jgi:hypothetical protein